MVYFSNVYSGYFHARLHTPGGMYTSISALCGVYLIVEIVSSILFRFCLPSPSPSLEYLSKNNEARLHETLCVIPCHMAAGSIREVVARACSVFPPHRVVVADNSSDPTPPDNTEAVVEALGASYMYTSMPNKTYSMVQAVARHADENIKYVVLLDDDTMLPRGFTVLTQLFEQDPLLAGYCPDIGVRKPLASSNLLESCINFEYRTISRANAIRGHFYTTRFNHGVCAVYRFDRFRQIYEQNPCLPGGLPFGEDAYAGVIARRMGYRLGQDQVHTVETFCPKVLCCGSRSQGFGASSLFKQRMRWCCSWIRRVPNELGLLLCWDAGSWLGNVMYRVDFGFWYVVLLLAPITWGWYVLKLYVTGSTFVEWGLLHAALYVTNMLTAIIRIASMRKTETIECWVPLVYPLFVSLQVVLVSLATVYSVLYYIPFVRDRRKLGFPGA